MKPNQDSHNPHPDSPNNEPVNNAQSVEAQRRREAVERSRIEKLLHAKADGEISEAQSAELTRLCSDHARFANEVKRTRLALDHLSILAPTPDFSARVVDACDSKVQFTTRPRRKTLRRNRLVLAAVSALLVIGVVFTHRFWPGWNQFNNRSEPLASVLSAGQKDFASSMRSLSSSGKLLATDVSVRLASIPDSPKATPTTRALARDTKLKLGDTSRFDKPVTSKVAPVVVMASQATGAGVGRRNIGNEGLIFADDQWLLASLSAPSGMRGSAPIMASMVMSHPFEASPSRQPQLQFWNLPSESDILQHSETADPLWPYWPNIAD